jgi:hypothetical protein
VDEIDERSKKYYRLILTFDHAIEVPLSDTLFLSKESQQKLMEEILAFVPLKAPKTKTATSRTDNDDKEE